VSVDTIGQFKLERLRYLKKLQQERERLNQAKRGAREYMPGARPKQISPNDPRHDCGPNCTSPDDDWIIWMVMAGRGWGKSKVGSSWIVHEALQQPETEWAILAPTFRDVSKTCIEGTTGVLQALGEDELVKYRRNECLIILNNGSKIFGYSADQPERIRGSNLWGAWCDELGSWRYEETWHEGLIPALRKGENPRIVVTTTPRPTMLVRNLVGRKDGSVHVTRGSTWENAANLSRTAIEELRRRYDGTRIGRQELEGELLDDIEGALWQRGDIDATRLGRDSKKDFVRVVIAIDPAVTSGEDADETGIVVCAEDNDGHGYVLADYSFQGTPNQTMQKVAWAYEHHEADCVVGEVNNGGDYIGNALRTVDPDIPYRAVRASRGKAVRAEPIAALYEQHRVHHLGSLAELEDQMCTWVPGIGSSPDRVDALVWAMTELRGLSSGSWADSYGIYTCGPCERMFPLNVMGTVRTRCPYCGTATD
jgi:phage terminase large subunit-like protein